MLSQVHHNTGSWSFPDNADEQAAWVRLSLIPGIGYQRLQALLAVYSAPSAILQQTQVSLRQTLSAGFAEKIINGLADDVLKRRAESIIEWSLVPGNQLIFPFSKTYPRRLAEIHSPPPLLCVQGNAELLNTPQVAMVGSRKPTLQGEENARRFALRLHDQGFTITSGLAIGVDGAAHQGTLAAGGSTIAVLGSGLDQVYPRRHKKLAAEISKTGLLVSEFPPDAQPHPTHFPRRNRIISGLSLGVLVVEASEKSGSLITARFALEQGREVFAIPGTIHNAQAAGCLQLIRSGAVLVQNSEQIVEELNGPLGVITASENASNQIRVESLTDDLTQQQILRALAGSESCHPDELSLMTGLNAQKLTTVLFELELQGLVATVAGGIALQI